MEALVFDCDGVLVDTERDGHRVAFNQAFAAKRLEVEWSTGAYGELLQVAGGKERMRHYFETHGWPADAGDHDGFVMELHRLKTDLFMQIIESGHLPLRSGVARVVDEAIAAGVKLAVCSTSNERAVHLIVDRMLGRERSARFVAILAGDVVANKKPAPDIYNLVKDRLGIGAFGCMVVEDSRNGLLAAKAAGMHCVITKSGYTGGEDFGGADAVYDELGDPPGNVVTLDDLCRIAG